MRRLLAGLLALVGFALPAFGQVGGGVYGPPTSAQIVTALGYTPANGANYCALAGCTMAGNIVIPSAAQLQTAGASPWVATATTAGTGASPIIDLYRNISAAANNSLAEFDFNGGSSTGVKRKFGALRGVARVSTNGSEAGGLILGGMNGSGVYADTFQVDGQVGPITSRMNLVSSIGGSVIGYFQGTGSVVNIVENNVGTIVATVYQATSAQSGDFGTGKGSALATTATGGFLLVPGGAGPPTGVPTNAGAGKNVLYVDETNSQLYLYIGGAWKQPKTPAGAATVTWQ